ARHNGYYVYINKEPVDISTLASLPAVYRGQTKHPSTQNVILFPGGQHGKKQMYIYLNKSNPVDTEGDEKNNVLDICEVEILGCVNNKSDGSQVIGCACPKQDEYPSEFCSNPTYNTLTTEIEGNSKKYYLEDEIITLRCKDNHTLVSGNLTRKCKGNESWNGEENVCKRFCPNATVNDNTTLVIQRTPHVFVNQNVIYKCKTNHRLVNGDLTRQCLNDSTWTGSQPICKRFCPNATFNDNTTLVIQRTPHVFVNQNVTYKCKTNHRLVNGDLTRQCLNDSTWTGSQPICKRFCPNATFNDNTTLVIQRTPHVFVNQNVTYKCKTNHRLVRGDLTRQCLNDSALTGSQPFCRKCQCPCKMTKSQNYIKDNEILSKVIVKRKKLLEVKKMELSSTIRQKTSAADERRSAQGVGMALGVGLITSVLSIIICSDLPLLCRHIRYGPQPQKRKCRARKLRR
ncbi:CUB and sushi domain-containing protein 3-like, partial [Saccostrea cucullata]|uniref:CUB and sushi domain-containing protein 3-like n=1 Tax=Saccostrea cuccullata TaxID=36930 RepID=UPI002ED5F77D